MEKIDKSFPRVHALDHVDFDLVAGEAHVLLGENGAEKSILMKALSGSIRTKAALEAITLLVEWRVYLV